MALPTSRDETCTPAAQVSSNLLNRIQDQIIGNKKPSTTKMLAPKIVNMGSTWTTPGVDTVQSASAQEAFFDVPSEVGDRITGLEVTAQGNGVVDATITLYYVNAGMVPTSMGALVDTNRAAAWGQAVVTPNITPHTMAVGERLRLSVNPNAAAYQVGTIRLIYDRL